MKKLVSYFWILALLGIIVIPACKAKEGCGLEEKYNNPNMESKGGKSNLFSKNQRKKMGRG